MVIEETCPLTLHQKILGDFQDNIISGKWPPGYRLPFEVEIAAQYNCSRMTVNKVMMHLVKAGMIERRRKSGTTVRRPATHSAILSIREISAEVASLGLPYHWQILHRHVHKSNKDEREKLHLSSPQPVLVIDCLHKAATAPFCFEKRLISLSNVNTAATIDFNRIPPGQWLLETVPWSMASHKISAINADAAIAEKLGISPATPCLSVERFTRNDKGPVTHVQIIYKGDSHSIIAEFEPV